MHLNCLIFYNLRSGVLIPSLTDIVVVCWVHTVTVVVTPISPLLSLGVGFTLVYAEIYSQDRTSVNIYSEDSVSVNITPIVIHYSHSHYATAVL